VIVFHVTERWRWQGAKDAGSYAGSTRDASLEDVGFVHCSFAQQVERVTNYLYDADFTDELVVLEIDTDRFDANVRVETLDGGDELFPHIYGAIPIDAVVAVRQMARSSRGWGVGGEIAP
jgi:uncharacterized protein (DUF952 family)